MTGSAIVVCGLQWGDEGKGKMVDLLAENVNAVVRFNGGNNAGHTLVVDGQKYVTHTLPSGIVRNGQANLVGPGVVCDPEVIIKELKIAAVHGSDVWLDRSAPVILPIHRAIDAGREAAAGSGKIGTTKKGIGPVYEDFWSRRGLKLGDMVSEQRIVERLRRGRYYDERLAVARFLGVEAMSFDETVAWCLQYSGVFKLLLADTRAIVRDMMSMGDRVLFEGAQGIMLDTVHGSQPYTTSSCCTAAGVSATFGVYEFERVIGIAKAYATRVGAGPFPTELECEVGGALREKGGEYGATTGRPRRCGWGDWVAACYAARVGGIREMVVTKVDVLSGFERVRACTSYVFEDKEIDKSDTLTTRVLEDSLVGYTSFPGWNEDITGCESIQDLPGEVGEYIRRMSSFVGLPVSAVSVGPERNQVATSNGFL
jgi:adenylosuccinate synthase